MLAIHPATSGPIIHPNTNQILMNWVLRPHRLCKARWVKSCTVGSSVGRVISSIRAVFNFAISEYAFDLKNPFLGMYFDKLAGVSKRLPIPIQDIRKVQQQCRLIDDDLRWLLALVSDTGMRLAEGVGLLKSDIILDADIPYISLKPHPWRPLKTSGSQRRYTACRGLSRQLLCPSQVQ